MSNNIMDLNTVTEQQLLAIQGIGKEHAKKIVDFRNQNGQFKTWEDLKRVPGVPGNMLDTLKRNGFTLGSKVA